MRVDFLHVGYVPDAKTQKQKITLHVNLKLTRLEQSKNAILPQQFPSSLFLGEIVEQLYLLLKTSKPSSTTGHWPDLPTPTVRLFLR